MEEKMHASNAQKMVLIALLDGWLLRKHERRGWCLFQPDWERPFASVSERNVTEMTRAGWLTPGESPCGLGTRPAKDLTPLGRAFAVDLKSSGWGRTAEWKRRNLTQIEIDDGRHHHLPLAA